MAARTEHLVALTVACDCIAPHYSVAFPALSAIDIGTLIDAPRQRHVRAQVWQKNDSGNYAL